MFRSPILAAFVGIVFVKNMKPAKPDNTTHDTINALRVLLATSMPALPFISSPTQDAGYCGKK
jgi:hypothetical protein